MISSRSSRFRIVLIALHSPSKLRKYFLFFQHGKILRMPLVASTWNAVWKKNENVEFFISLFCTCFKQERSKQIVEISFSLLFHFFQTTRKTWVKKIVEKLQVDSIIFSLWSDSNRTKERFQTYQSVTPSYLPLHV